jgi:type IV secretory pathway VirJ component
MMKHICILVFVFAGFSNFVSAQEFNKAIHPASAVISEEIVKFGPFGEMNVYKTPKPSQVVLFVSGDGGWNLGVVDMAREFASLGALVVGIDIRHYLKYSALEKTSCTYAASDFELLSKFIQQKFSFPEYIEPVLVGYSSGATLVYAVLAQSPPNTFAGGLSLGFCPDLDLKKPLCHEHGLEWSMPSLKKDTYIFLPKVGNSYPWKALVGDIDKVCNVNEVAKFTEKTGNAALIRLPKVGHGFSVTRNWMPQFKKAYIELAKSHSEESQPSEEKSSNDDLKGIPIVEIPPKVGAASTTDYLAIIISGDGGWANIDKEIAGTLSVAGVPSVGLNSLKYFWKGKTPQEASSDLKKIIDHYLPAWNKKRAVLIGYSLGADVLPFMVSRLPEGSLKRVPLITLIGPSRAIDFEFHTASWLGISSKSDQPVLPEIEKIKGINILCIFGGEETDSLCNDLGSKTAIKVIPFKGGHHLGHDYDGLTRIIVDNLK